MELIVLEKLLLALFTLATTLLVVGIIKLSGEEPPVNPPFDTDSFLDD